MFLPRKILEKKLLRMLAEDVGQGDVTTALITPSGVEAEAEIVAKEAGVVAGAEEVTVFLESLGLSVQAFVRDGEELESKQVLFKVLGDVRTVLSAERTVLNVLSRMSGIATTTRRLVVKLQKAGLRTRIACTRKTAPGLLYFDKKAVAIGGGDTHRLHLDDMVLIKDNHIVVAGGIGQAVRMAKKKSSFTKKIEIEVTKAEDALTAAKAGVDIVMLDNFSPKQIETACKMLKEAKLYGRILLEASGGITEANVLSFASTGVDIVSLGEITSGARPLNMSLEVSRVTGKPASSRLRGGEKRSNRLR